MMASKYLVEWTLFPMQVCEAVLADGVAAGEAYGAPWGGSEFAAADRTD